MAMSTETITEIKSDYLFISICLDLNDRNI